MEHYIRSVKNVIWLKWHKLLRGPSHHVRSNVGKIHNRVLVPCHYGLSSEQGWREGTSLISPCQHKWHSNHVFLVITSLLRSLCSSQVDKIALKRAYLYIRIWSWLLAKVVEGRDVKTEGITASILYFQALRHPNVKKKILILSSPVHKIERCVVYLCGLTESWHWEVCTYLFAHLLGGFGW